VFSTDRSREPSRGRRAGGAEQRVTYILKGGADEVYKLRFSFQGFCYVAVEGWPGEPTLDRLTGIVVHSDMPVIGLFETSSPALDQLQHNIRWSQKGNFLDVPTDCPQRDERLGWTGDAQIFARTAAVLGKRDDATVYEALLRKIRKAFVREFVTAAGRVGENTQTAYVLALQFDMLPTDQRHEAARRLAADVRARGHLTTGFVGTPYLCDVLSRYGYTDLRVPSPHPRRLPVLALPREAGGNDVVVEVGSGRYSFAYEVGPSFLGKTAGFPSS
jgi:hypothetical protein